MDSECVVPVVNLERKERRSAAMRRMMRHAHVGLLQVLVQRAHILILPFARRRFSFLDCRGSPHNAASYLNSRREGLPAFKFAN